MVSCRCRGRHRYRYRLTRLTTIPIPTPTPMVPVWPAWVRNDENCQHRRSQMSSRLSCPICKAPVSLWRIVIAPLPTRIRCGHCRARLKAAGNKTLFYVIAVLLGGLIGFFLWSAFLFLREHLGPYSAFFDCLALCVMLVFFCDFPLSYYIYARGRLEPAGKTPPSQENPR
jgi:hypothetical protein